MTLTYTELHTFLKAAEAYLGSSDRPDGKFTYAVLKVKKAAAALFQKYQDAVSDLEVEHATEENGKLLRDPQGRYVYDRANQLALNRAIRAWHVTTVELDGFIAPESSIPADVPSVILDAFDGLIIERDQAA